MNRSQGWPTGVNATGEACSPVLQWPGARMGDRLLVLVTMCGPQHMVQKTYVCCSSTAADKLERIMKIDAQARHHSNAC